MRRSAGPWRAACGVLLLAAAACSPAAETTGTVAFDTATVQVEWIRKDPERRSAAAKRGPLPDAQGILVGYSEDRIHHYHATGSSGGFDVLFLSAEGKVLERHFLSAASFEKLAEGVTSRGPARYALIVGEGWCARNNVDVGHVARFSEAILRDAPQALPDVRVGGVPLRVEVATSGADKSRGLMYRRALSPDGGMLFIYPRPKEQSFWMGNCYIGLDIAFFDADGNFLNVESMDPYADPKGDGPRAVSKGPAQFIVEARKGWFRAKGLVDAEGRPTKRLILEMPAEVRALVKEAE